ncbi:hypothetical protein Tsubulata_029923, partial [Turnera subulata]
YPNSVSGLVYTSDSSYVDAGVSKSIATQFRTNNVDQQQWYVRSFPEGVRNCYKIEVTTSTKYLIRATFMYGNYDGLYKLPAFDLYLGPNKWDSLQIQNVSKPLIQEIIYTPTLNYVHVCLVKTDSSTPFISALELRPLRNTTYVTESGSLVLFNRVDVGSITNRNVRYPDDIFDRLWYPLNYNGWSILNTSQTVDNENHNVFQPPSAVMSTAGAPTNDSEPIVISIDNPENKSLSMYYYMHFAEIVKLEANQSRVFNVSVNGQPWVGPISPNYLYTTTAYSTSAVSNQTNVFSIFKVGNSTLPPLLNALESTYAISRNWQGDPCAPEDYAWEGLNCSYNGTAPPRIISLDLSGNHLTGNIPGDLYERSQSGSLSLRVGGNPGLCPSVSCKKKNKNTVVKVVAPIAAVLVLVAVLVEMRTDDTHEPLEAKKRQFTYSEVLTITNNFEKILGKGGFGIVYYGFLDGTQVAVKMLSQSSAQGDVKTTNILLNEKFQAKLSDFGLSRTFPLESDSHVSTVAAGTPGYLDPDYWGTNWLTEKSDVYSFGVVLLEIITSRPVIVKGNEKSGHISDWVRSAVERGDIRSIIDPKLHGSYDVNSGWRVVELALSCVSTSPADRPTMNQVVTELNECFATLTRDDEDTSQSKNSAELMSLQVNTGLTPLVSIDCGLPPNTSYPNPVSGLIYTSDSSYADTGVSKSIATQFRTNGVDQQQWYVRSFPEGVRNCYKIEVTTSTKYLIRANFMYGNYDGLFKLPAFDLYLGPNKWATVQIQNVSKSVFTEIIYTPTLNYVHVCLVKTDSSTPFISALELRPLRNTTYVTESGSLVLFNRADLGSITKRNVRYPDDIFDRIWFPFNYNEWSILNTSQTVDNENHNFFQPPSAVMSTAATPTNDSVPIVINIDNPQNKSMAMYYYMHFAEIVKLEANQSRVFNVSLNGQPWEGPISPNYLHTITAYSTSAVSNQTNVISIYKVGNSTLPPLLNALEAYRLSTYGISRNWQGDPCAPEDFAWEGLNCSYDAAPRIISLNLSSWGLLGEITSEFANLKLLESLYLSGNHLTGNIPGDLYARSQSGSLSLSRTMHVQRTIEDRHEPLEAKRRQFTYSEVLTITNNFEKILGKGAFGIVYHGLLDGTQVAVKMLSQSSAQGYKEFQAEAISLPCNDRSPMDAGAYPHTLNWETRIRITYLHNGCKPPIIHRDVKGTNILLNEKFQAKLSDFGLSRTFPLESESHVSTVAAGTPGYLDPDYWGTNWLTEKSDVYSFGVVLLEIITSRPVLMKVNEKSGHISDWVRSAIERGDIGSIIDPKLHGSYDVNSAWRVVELALSCLSTSPADRPTMNQVVAELNDCFATLTRGDEDTSQSKDSAELMSPQVHSGLTPMVR